VFYGVWGVLAIVTMVLDVIDMMNHFTWIKFWGAFFQLIIVIFITRHYWKLDREAALKRRRKARVKRFAEKFARSEHPYRMPKVEK
jgi:hypothetical protein